MVDCKECQNEYPSDEFLRRHVKKHKMTFQEYALKWIYEGKIPNCKCGCGKETSWNVALKAYAEFVLGHHAYGRKKSDEEREAIGKANSINMTRYMAENPEIAKEKGKQLRSTWTPEVEARRIEATREAYRNLTDEQRKKFSDHAIRLLELGKIGPQAPYRAEWVLNPFTNKQEYMHSSWETLFLERCVSVGVPVTKSHSIRISYTGPDSKTHDYVPDFITTDDWPDRILFEVKGQEDEWDVLKEIAGRDWCTQNNFQYVKIRKS